MSWSSPVSTNGIILEYQIFYVGYEKHEIEEKMEKVGIIFVRYT